MAAKQKSDLRNAIRLFRQGDFNTAKTAFTELLTSLPGEKSVELYAGYISLLENRLIDAAVHLNKALLSMPHSKAVKSLLLYAYYRQDDFTNAAPLLDALKLKHWAEKLAYLAKYGVYDTVSSACRAELDFLAKDPLPLIEVSINGAPCVNLLIDTGGSELIIDTEYAKSLGLGEFGPDKQTFGGGKKGTIIHSCIDSIQLGDFQVRRLPVFLLDTRRLSSELYGDKYWVDGILGTCMFYHFLTILDYAKSKIIFELAEEDTEKRLDSRLADYAHIPFWLAGEHCMLAKGGVNGKNEMLFFIDTGLGGNAFTCPKSTVKKCGFVLERGNVHYGTGGGGKVKSIPFDIEDLSLGGIHEKNVTGLFGPFPPEMEKSFGFTIDGLISHEFFKNHTVVFDYSKMTLHIK